MSLYKCPDSNCPFTETLKTKIYDKINRNIITTEDEINTMSEISKIIKQNIPIKYIEDQLKCKSSPKIPYCKTMNIDNFKKNLESVKDLKVIDKRGNSLPDYDNIYNIALYFTQEQIQKIKDLKQNGFETSEAIKLIRELNDEQVKNAKLLKNAGFKTIILTVCKSNSDINKLIELKNKHKDVDEHTVLMLFNVKSKSK
jgi:hypothetical protein